MRRSMLVLIICSWLVSVIAAAAQPSEKPKITPFFSQVDQAPAFYVECRNDTGAPVSSAALRWAWSQQFD